MEITLLVIILISVIQSVFGVGVLLFGTPILILFGYDFKIALMILLPISISISFLQTVRNFNDIDISFFKGFIVYSIPFLICFLAIGIYNSVNFNLIIGPFLILVSLKSKSDTIRSILNSLGNYKRLGFIFMGIIHGLTNLGGSLLTVIIFNKNLSKKQTRSTIAICYATFAIFQILTLISMVGLETVLFHFNVKFFLVGVLSFFIAETLIFSKVNVEKYESRFAIFILISGLSLVLKEIYGS